MYKAYRLQPKLGAGFNIQNIKQGELKNFGHTITLNGGLDYKITNSLHVSTAFNSDFTPFSILAAGINSKFGMISYSLTTGLRIDL